jgi:hypothetical protein
MHDDVGVSTGCESGHTDWQRMTMAFTSALVWLLASGVDLIDDEDVASELLLRLDLREEEERVFLPF